MDTWPKAIAFIAFCLSSAAAAWALAWYNVNLSREHTKQMETLAKNTPAGYITTVEKPD